MYSRVAMSWFCWMFKRRDDGIEPDAFVLDVVFRRLGQDFSGEHAAFVFVPGHAFGAPHQADHVGIVLLHQGHHAVHALGAGHDGVDQGLAFMDLETGFHGGDVGGIQGQGHIGHHFLDGLDDPLHQFFAAFAGRADIDIDKIHPGLGLFQGHLLEGLGVALLHGLTINFGHHVQVFADSVKFTHQVTPFLTAVGWGRKP